MFHFLGKVLSSIGLGVASYFGLWSEPVIEVHQPIVIKEIQQVGASDSVLPIGGATYTLSGSGLSSSATSITLSSLTLPQTGQKLQDSDFSTTFYVTLEPGNRTRQEFVSCTTVTQNSVGTATLSGCARGLSPITPYTASSTLQFAHAGGTQVIFSDPPQLFNQFYALGNNATSTGSLAFSSTTPPHYDISMNTGAQYGSSSQLASKGYVDAQTVAGCSNADGSTKGCVAIGTKTQIASSTATGQGPSGTTYVVGSNSATSTPGGNNHSGSGNTYVVVTKDNGYIDQGFIDLTDSYAWTGTQTFVKATTTNATTTSLSVTGLASTSQLTVTNGLGIGNGVATSSTGNARVQNYLQVDGTASTSRVVISNSCVGCFKYTGSTSPLALSTGSRAMGGTDASINFGIGVYAITDSSNAACTEQGTFFVAREGATSVIVGGMDGDGTGSCDGQYTITFDSSTGVQETTDISTDSSLAGSIYWYR